jgi:molecular chaperone DnaJ
MSKDFYSILGVSKTATDTEIKKAYRRMALQFHPDKNKGDKQAEAKFKEMNEAYEVLSDKQKRENYDHFGSAGPGMGGGFDTSGFGGQGFSGQGFDFSQFSGQGGFADIFETFFGAGQGGSGTKKQGPRPGEDIEFQLQLTFEEAAFGIEKELMVTKAATCDNCHGSGAEPGSKSITCQGCRGTGEIRAVRQTLFGQMATSRVCNECYGEGRVHEKKCGVCHGTTRVRKSEKIRVKIPAGVDNESTVRLSGRGEAGVFGGPYGDLYVHIRVQPSKKYIRNGYDVHSELHIHMLQAILGDEIEVETLKGAITLKIPAGTQSGKIFKLKDFGIEKLRSSGTGDHFVKIIVDVPVKLSRKEKELYSELAKESGISSKGKDGFFKKFMG